MNKQYYAYLVLLSLAACGPAQNDPGPGGVTVGEAQALDDAAEMLDERNSLPKDGAATKNSASK